MALPTGSPACARVGVRPLPRSRHWLAALALLGGGPTSALAADPARVPPLTAVAGTPRLPGKFVWADLVTDDAEAARRFYAQLFGWTFREVGGYRIASNQDRPVCGIFQRPRPKDRAAEPRWFGYISVADVERAGREVSKGGGRVLAPPREVPYDEVGFSDPWYYGGDRWYDDDIAVPPDARPGLPPRPAHPIARPPMAGPRPMPSIPSRPRPSVRR